MELQMHRMCFIVTDTQSQSSITVLNGCHFIHLQEQTEVASSALRCLGCHSMASMASRWLPSISRCLQWLPRLAVILQDGIFEHDRTPRDDTHDLLRLTGFPQIPQRVFFSFFADVTVSDLWLLLWNIWSYRRCSPLSSNYFGMLGYRTTILEGKIHVPSLP